MQVLTILCVEQNKWIIPQSVNNLYVEQNKWIIPQSVNNLYVEQNKWIVPNKAPFRIAKDGHLKEKLDKACCLCELLA